MFKYLSQHRQNYDLEAKAQSKLIFNLIHTLTWTKLKRIVQKVNQDQVQELIKTATGTPANVPQEDQSMDMDAMLAELEGILGTKPEEVTTQPNEDKIKTLENELVDWSLAGFNPEDKPEIKAIADELNQLKGITAPQAPVEVKPTTVATTPAPTTTKPEVTKPATGPASVTGTVTHTVRHTPSRSRVTRTRPPRPAGRRRQPEG
jgi:hypothetical protein